MDNNNNNILACAFGIEQLEKISKVGIKVDFNEGLTTRLIDKNIVKLFPLRVIDILI